MSGHSRWSQIKHQKGIADVKKGQLFSKLGKLISIAAKKGADPSSNQSLAGAIERARAANMPKENIERAIKKAADKDAAVFEEITVLALGPGGIGITIKAITDNRNRTIGEIKNILAKHSAKMVQWVPGYPVDADKPTREALERLFEELDANDDVDSVTSNVK